MRSALICVFFALIVQKEGSRAEQDDDFRPTPIPLNNWSGERRELAGTLQEFINTDAPPTVAALPAHYWEDALRHSVYLTLVRDKIDQLIAKGTVISPDSKPDNLSKEVDDHDLWEKIKAAPFDRVKEEPIPPSDVTIIARGALLQEKNGYRFAEDDALTEKCKDNCTQAVKAYWSVKRVRQGETSPGKYHYELTFSVTSQAPKKIKKPYENPMRTFTIRENNPTEHPPLPTYHNHKPQVHSERTQRAIWVHKNIAPSQAHSQTYHKRPANPRGLDRIFSSLFSDDDNYDEVPYRRKPNSYVSHGYPQQQQQHQQQHAKVGFGGDREPYPQKKLGPYPVKPQNYRYSRPPLPAPPPYAPNPYADGDHSVLNQQIPIHFDNKYNIPPIPPNLIKTTKPAVLPTPVSNYNFLKDSTVDVPVKTTLNATDYIPTTREPDVLPPTTTYRIHTHAHSHSHTHNHKQPPKMSYFSENIRPPVYNAPPGVFVTMDNKKPFKPMPPIKYNTHSSKPHKNLPFDFRPSPQILDSSYDSDTSADTAFRPITLNLTELFNSKKGPKNRRKPISKKPLKKLSHVKPHRLTTISPDIITAHMESSNENDEMQWAEILGAFTKTTPMASQTESSSIENDFVTTTTDTPTTTEKYEEPTTTPSTTTTATTTTTTYRPKRTRPPPKFTKPEKVRKHKRITSTTTTTTTTAKPTRIYHAKKSSDDLTPQASSAATSGANSVRETKHKGVPSTTSTTTTTTSTSTSTTPTTSRTTTTTRTNPPTTSSSTTTPTTTTQGPTGSSEHAVVTTQPRSKNRFRQSTLMHKGTSVNHDKWSATLDKNKTTSNVFKLPLRRKASKFQGYVPSSTPRLVDKERDKEDHRDYGFRREQITTTVHSNEDILVRPLEPTQPTIVEASNKVSLSEWGDDDEGDDMIEVEEEKESDDQESKDDSEYIFSVTSDAPDVDIEASNHIKHITVDQQEVTLPKNKTKCKKRKNHTSTDNIEAPSKIEITTLLIPTASIVSTSTEKATTPDIFDEIFGGFTMDDMTEKPKTQTTTAPEPAESESAKHQQYIPIDDDLEDFLHSLDQKSNEADSDEDDDYEEENDDEDSPFNNEEDNLDSRNLNEEYYDDHPEHKDKTLLELMAME